jgi:Transposase DDE domain
VSVEPANKSDANALIPFIEDTKERDLGPEEVLADTLYGGDENVEKAASEMKVEVVSPVKGTDKDENLSLTDFTLSDKRKVTSCPKGHVPFRTKHKKERHSAAFEVELCASCPLLEECPVKPGKNGYYLRYDDRAARLAVRRAYERTSEFRERYRFRAGIEATMSYYDRKTGVKRLRVRGLKAVTCCAVLKATGVNILRAAAFKNRKNQDNGPDLPPFQPVLGLFIVVKELLSLTMNDLRIMMRQPCNDNRLPIKTIA